MPSAKEFQLSDGAKQKLTKAQTKKIKAMYENIAKSAAERAKSLPKDGTVSEQLRKVYLQEYQKQIGKEIDSLSKTLEGSIKTSMTQSSQLVVDATNTFMGKAGLEIKGAWSYVPKDVVENLSSGKLYRGDWNLSQAIWKNGSKTKSDILEVVSRGIAEQKPTYDIAKDVEKYLNPKALKDWSWSKVYPGTNRRVDYAAQRLSRTMIQHSYQLSLKQTAKANPFVEGIMWNAAFAHGRTCEVCADRDGEVYLPKDLPLDHPNGLCSFSVETAKLSDISNEIADWIGGAENKKLDKYYEAATGIKPTKMSKKASKVEKVKEFSIKEFVSQKLQGFKSVMKEGLFTAEGEFADEIVADLMERVKTLEEIPLKAMEKAQRNFRHLEAQVTGTSSYSHGFQKIKWTYIDDTRNYHGRGKYDIIFHEYGHTIDHTLGIHTSAKYRKELFNLMKSEYESMLDPDGGRLKFEIWNKLRKNDKTCGIQDIISGLTKDKGRIRWGHSASYWEKQGQVEGTVKEACAHFFSCWCDPEKDALMTKYFPKSYGRYKEIVAGFVK